MIEFSAILTVEAALKAVERNGDALRYVKEQSEAQRCGPNYRSTTAMIITAEQIVERVRELREDGEAEQDIAKGYEGDTDLVELCEHHLASATRDRKAADALEALAAERDDLRAKLAAAEAQAQKAEADFAALKAARFNTELAAESLTLMVRGVVLGSRPPGSRPYCWSEFKRCTPQRDQAPPRTLSKCARFQAIARVILCAHGSQRRGRTVQARTLQGLSEAKRCGPNLNFTRETKCTPA